MSARSAFLVVKPALESQGLGTLRDQTAVLTPDLSDLRGTPAPVGPQAHSLPVQEQLPDTQALPINMLVSDGQPRLDDRLRTGEEISDLDGAKLTQEQEKNEIRKDLIRFELRKLSPEEKALQDSLIAKSAYPWISPEDLRTYCYPLGEGPDEKMLDLPWPSGRSTGMT